MLEGLTEQQIQTLEAELLALVPAEGSVGNVTLVKRLTEADWSAEQYWAIRNRLIDRAVLMPGRGKGGSVRRLPESVPVVAEDAAPGPAPRIEDLRERALYEPMKQVIDTAWAQDNRLDQHIVEITAHQGARLTGGRWTRPDITLASMRTFAYVPGKHFDVVTFEIKPCDTIDVTAIYEALAHRRAAHRAYALLHVPHERKEQLEALVLEVAAEAKRHGIGLIVANDPADYETWDELVAAVRHEPDPERLNDFLAQQLSVGFRERLVRWFR